jgi:subtilisin family serine protease
MSEREYVVIVKADVDIESFDAEVAADTGAGQIPNRAVTVANPRIGSKRMTHWMLTDEEAETLAQDDRVVAVEIPPDQRTDMDIGLHARQTAVFERQSGNNSTWVNWGLRRCDEATNTFADATTLSGDHLYALNGTGVDFIVQDSGIQADHPEFAIPIDPEYNNSAVSDVVGDGSDFFKREVTVNGVRIMAAGGVGGQTAVPDSFVEKVARMFELFTDPTGTGINGTAQRALIKNLSGDTGTYHVGKPTIQRVARGAGADYSTNFLTDAGIIFWNLTDLFDATVQNDMVWYLNSTGGAPGDGDQDAQEVIEHVFHTIHMHGLDAQTLKLYPFLSSDWNTGPLYNAMVEAYDGGFWDSAGYGGDTWKTNGEAFEVAAKEYLYLLNFCMFDYSSLWDGGSLSPEWSDSMRTPAGIQSNNPLGYALHNSYIAPVISKPTLATIRNIFQDGDTGDPTVAGASGYVVDTGSRVQQIDWFAGSGIVGETQDQNFYTDYDGHGTHCAGIAAGKTFGWAKNARIYAQKLGGLEGTADPNNGISITNAFDCIRLWHNNKSGADANRPTVVNMSWGYGFSTTSDPTSGTYRGSAWTYGVDYSTRAELETATGVGIKRVNSGTTTRLSTRNATVDAEIEDMVSAGIHVVIAAGNNYNKVEAFGGTDYDNDVLFGATTINYHRGSSPYSSNAFMVASLDSTTQDDSGTEKDRTSIFSSRGPGCNIWAPGSDIMSACSTPYDASKFAPISYFGDASFYQMSISGTSMAAPQVAGLLCLHLESSPTLTPAQLKSKIIADSNDVVYNTGANNDYDQINTSTFGQDAKIIYSRYASANALSITTE